MKTTKDAINHISEFWGYDWEEVYISVDNYLDTVLGISNRLPIAEEFISDELYNELIWSY